MSVSLSSNHWEAGDYGLEYAKAVQLVSAVIAVDAAHEIMADHSLEPICSALNHVRG